MIDHDAAADLWDRYKRGERNVFTRRLYTLQGQKAFDEIRRKYRADREFKQTVDRYIGEFERLLEEVSRDDRGQVVARTYLDLGNRQGLHHAGARGRPLRLTRDCGAARKLGEPALVAGFVYLAVPGSKLRIATGRHLSDSTRVQRTAWGDVTLNGQTSRRQKKQ